MSQNIQTRNNGNMAKNSNVVKHRLNSPVVSIDNTDLKIQELQRIINQLQKQNQMLANQVANIDLETGFAIDKMMVGIINHIKIGFGYSFIVALIFSLISMVTNIPMDMIGYYAIVIFLAIGAVTFKTIKDVKLYIKSWIDYDDNQFVEVEISEIKTK